MTQVDSLCESVENTVRTGTGEKPGHIMKDLTIVSGYFWIMVMSLYIFFLRSTDIFTALNRFGLTSIEAVKDNAQ